MFYVKMCFNNYWRASFASAGIIARYGRSTHPALSALCYPISNARALLLRALVALQAYTV